MAATAAAEDPQGAGRIKELSARLRSFYTDVRSEMKKVTAPSWKEVRGTTLVVLVTVAIFGLYFYAVDFIFSHVIDTIINHFSR